MQRKLRGLPYLYGFNGYFEATSNTNMMTELDVTGEYLPALMALRKFKSKCRQNAIKIRVIEKYF